MEGLFYIIHRSLFAFPSEEGGGARQRDGGGVLYNSFTPTIVGYTSSVNGVAEITAADKVYYDENLIVDHFKQ